MRYNAVVVVRVGPEPLSDACEIRLADVGARQHQCRESACDPPVAVAERMNHHQIRVRHRRAHHRIAVKPVCGPPGGST